MDQVSRLARQEVRLWNMTLIGPTLRHNEKTLLESAVSSYNACKLMRLPLVFYKYRQRFRSLTPWGQFGFRAVTILLVSGGLLWIVEGPSVEERIANELINTAEEMLIRARTDYGGIEFIIEVPARVRLGSTPEISVQMDAGVRKIAAAAKLEAPAFEISPVDSTQHGPETHIGWFWTLKPRETGDHTVRVVFDSPLLPQDLRIVSGKPDILRVSPDSLTFRVEVVDDLGLSRFQRGILKAAGALLAFISALLALPLFERFFKRKDASTDRRIVAR